MAGTTCTSTPVSTTTGSRPELRAFVDAIPATEGDPVTEVEQPLPTAPPERLDRRLNGALLYRHRAELSM